MSLFAVVIPQKEITIDFSIQDIKIAILKLPKMLDNCKIINQNDILNRYDMQFTSFMSLGNKLSVTLTQLSENKTKITVDTTRMSGTFKESHEVTSADTDYTKMTDSLSKLLSNPNITDDEMKSNSDNNSNAGLNIVLGVIFVIIMIYIFF